MKLDEIIREKTQHILASLAELEEEHTQKVTACKLTENQVQIARTQINSKQSTAREIQSKNEQIEEQLQRLKDQLAEIEEKRKSLMQVAGTFQRELEANQNAMQEFQAEARRTEENLQKAQQSYTLCQQDLQKIIEEKKLTQDRLQFARSKVFAGYLAEASQRFEAAFRQFVSWRKSEENLAAFKRSLKEDRTVREIYNAWQEWHKINKSDAPEAVRETAQREQRKLQDEINKRFPDALLAKDKKPNFELHETLYCYTNSEGKRIVIMPLSEKHWQELQNGTQGRPDTSIMHFLWWIIQEAGFDAKHAYFQLSDKFVELVMGTDSDPLDKNAISLQLDGVGNVSLELMPLPQEIREVLTQEPAGHQAN